MVVGEVLHRGVIRIGGREATKFLQGLVTSNVAKLAATHDCQATAFLSTKGRILGDGLLARRKDGSYLIDCALETLPALLRQLKLMKLRSKSTIEDQSETMRIIVKPATDADSESSNIDELGQMDGVEASFIDPRCRGLGTRVIAKAEDAGWLGQLKPPDVPYNQVRLSLGIAEGLELAERTPMECNLDLLNHISFTKGCYVGQELTARTHFKGVVRKRLLPLVGIPTPPGWPTPLLRWDQVPQVGGFLLNCKSVPLGTGILDISTGANIGQVVATGEGYRMIAMIRLDKVMGGATPICKLESDLLSGVQLLPYTPQWWPTNLNMETGQVPATSA